MLLHSTCRGLLATLHIKTHRIAPGLPREETGDREVQTAGRSARYRGLRARCQVRARARCGYGEA
jgi:hypothetical protein